MKGPLIFRPWVWHPICCAVALLSCVPILWPQVFLPDQWEQIALSYAGAILLGSMLLSFTIMCACSFLHMMRLRNLRAFGHLLAWAVLWLISAALFVLLAYMADVPMPGADKAAADPIQRTDTLHTPGDHLTGPSALVIPTTPERFPADSIINAPNLTLLEQEHSNLLHQYITSSPRWALYTADDTFYTKPGHVVMPPLVTGGISGLVHVAFRHIVEGEPLPSGYTIVSPGDPMPVAPESSEQMPDLALDLGRNHYLLLAWRGTSHSETAHRAMNAAIATVDAMVEPLAQDPQPATVQKMLIGKQNISASTPELLLSQPPAQYGAYQAEIYANPGEPGTLILRIAELDADDTTLRLFSCPALYSANPEELFRHDIPGSIPEQMLASSFGHDPDLLPDKAPLFAIRRGEPHQFFGVAFEVVFIPANSAKPRRTILRRCYRVQAIEAPASPPAPANRQES